MRVSLTAKQEKELNRLRPYFPTYELTDFIDLARLREPHNFPYSKRDALNKKFAKKITERLQDIMAVYPSLPKRLQNEIQANTNFYRFVSDDILRPMVDELKQKQKKKKIRQKDKEEIYRNMDLLYKIYSRNMEIGLNGLLTLMPYQFSNYLFEQIKPIIDLMRAISQYTNEIKGFKPLLKDYSYEYGGLA